MKIEKIQNKEIWKNFLSKCSEKTFLSSWNWGKFQEMMGNKIWRRGVYKNENLIAVAFFYKIKAKRGNFLFLPHGPVFKKPETSDKRQVFKILLEELKKIAKKEKVSFIRIAPVLKRSEENIKIFKSLGFREAPIHIHPELTWELDITPSKDELLTKMRKTTRYLIRQAQRKYQIEIEQRDDIEGIKIFNQIYEKTANRHHFVPFTFEYLKNELLAFQGDNQIEVFLGKYKGEIISSGIFVYWQNIGFYHHGASMASKIPVSYLLLWEAIKKAKERGCQKFNFWGIAPEDRKNHPWWGLTLFKKGFGGFKKEYVKTQDYVISSKYWLNFIVEIIRKKKRRL